MENNQLEQINWLIEALDSSNQFEYRGFYCQQSGVGEQRTWIIYGPDLRRLPQNGINGFKNINDVVELINGEFD